jgi:hypothetical protein
MTICLPISTSALNVWKNSSWVEDLPGDELHVVDHQHVDGAEHLLEADRVLFAQRADEAVHELLGREVEDVGLGEIRLKLPRDGVHQVRLAEAHAAVEEQRVERDVAAFGHAARGGLGQFVGLADDEILEGELRVEVGAGGDLRPFGGRMARGLSMGSCCGSANIRDGPGHGVGGGGAGQDGRCGDGGLQFDVDLGSVLRRGPGAVPGLHGFNCDGPTWNSTRSAPTPADASVRRITSP